MIDIAVVGAGAWGKNHIRVFSEIPNVRLKYVCDQDSTKLGALKKTYPQTKMVEDLKPILEDPGVRGVVVASSAFSHYSLSKDLMQAGKDVLVEKPMALSVKDAEEMIEISEKRKRILMVGHLLIYHPVVDRLKEMVLSGELGTPRKVIVFSRDEAKQHQERDRTQHAQEHEEADQVASRDERCLRHQLEEDLSGHAKCEKVRT
jgi:predicted dehydrogenase